MLFRSTRENISVNEAIHTKDSLSSLPDSALRCIKPPLNPVRIIVEIRSIDYISVNGDTQMKDSLSSLPDSVLRNMKPPLSPGRILGEVGAGILGSIAGAFGGALIFGAIYYGSGGGVDENAFNAIMITGFSLGSSSGVYLVGNKGNQTGSFWATVSSSAIGGIIGLTIESFVKGNGEIDIKNNGITLTITGLIAGALLAHSYSINDTINLSNMTAPEKNKIIESLISKF